MNRTYMYVVCMMYAGRMDDDEVMDEFGTISTNVGKDIFSNKICWILHEPMVRECELMCFDISHYTTLL